MTHAASRLETLQKALKESKAAAHIAQVYLPGYQDKRLSLRQANASRDEETIIHILVDDKNCEKFSYSIISNEVFGDAYNYEEVESKEGVSEADILEIVYRVFAT